MSTLKVNNIQSVTDGSVSFPQGLSSSNEPLSVPDGTVSSPSVRFSNDTDTGLYRISNNTIGVATNGTERLRIDGSGNIGIGTTSPGGSSTDRVITLSGSASSVIYCLTTGVQGSYGVTSSGWGLLGTIKNHPLVFNTNNVERMRISASGSVGIGTTSPAQPLHIAGSYTSGNGPFVFLQNTAVDNSTTAFGQGLMLRTGRTSDSDIFVGTYQSNSRFIVALGSTPFTELFTILQNGNVGIGTTDPNRKLYVNGNMLCTNLYVDDPTVSNQYVGISLANRRTTGTTISFIDSPGRNGISDSSMFFTHYADYSSDISFYTQIAGTNTDRRIERMRIDTNGYLLIGYSISNGVYRLQVNGQIFATSSTIATSDGRYKENIQPLSGALNLVTALNPVQFDWKKHPIHNFDTETPTVGFIAQEVEEVLADKPYLNSIIKRNQCTIEPEEKDEEGNIVKEAVIEEFLGIAEGNMIALLTKAIQELKEEVDNLKTQIS